MAEASDVDRIVEVIAFQAAACAQSGSPLYGRVLDAVADDLRAGGVSARLLSGRSDDPFGSALALRFLGATHRLVLDGRAPALAAHYPSAGGVEGPELTRTFLATIEEHESDLERMIEDGVQTNEVGRSAVLVGGFATVTHRTTLPLRVLEVGASAGLNLRWDHFAYDTGRVVSGDPDSPVRFSGMWVGDPPDLPPRFEVAERAGCDRNPLDATTPEGRLTLMSYVWPDQVDRFERLEAAIEVARRVPAPIDRADADAWLADRLTLPLRGVATVVVHSIVLQYLPKDSRAHLRSVIHSAGARASGASPLAWLRMEPAGDRAELRLTTWPGGDDRVLATAGYHGHPIWWGDPG
ncbi:MAG: DUF2332 domain-containing protein [Acidimicrobiales bacterium]